MLHMGRYILIAAGLTVAGLLIAACGGSAPPSPTVTPGQASAQQVSQPVLVTNTGDPTPMAMEPASPTSTSTSKPSQTATPSLGASTSTPTRTPTSSPMPSTATSRPTATATPVPSLTPQRTLATPAPVATRTRPAPSDTPSPYRFQAAGPAQPDPSHPCPGCPKAAAYIVGHVHDAAGNPLAGVRLVCYNEWHRYPVVASKGGGEYDFAIIQAATTWTVVVLDQADQPISPEVAVVFDPQQTCRYIVDWRRVNR
jgi:hypothetical protein